MEEFLRLAKKYENKLIENRRWLHKNPEVGLVIPKTAEYVRRELEDIGYEVVPCIESGFSVTVGKNQKDGRCMMLRADMDALPMEEETDLDFASKNGSGHLCGHDMHTAVLLTVARILKEKEDSIEGCIKLMFQPGEENANGCSYMVEAGILENPTVHAAVALHVKPNYENGTIHYIKGPSTSSIDAFEVTVHGEAAHGSTPEKAIDPLFASANMYMALNGLVGREISAFKTAVLSIGVLGGGTAPNAIPEMAYLKGTIRSYAEEDRTRILNRVKTIIRCEAEMANTTYDFYVHSTPGCYNDPALCEGLLPYLAEAVGEENIIEEELPAPSSEDFSYVTLKVPSMVFWFGVGKEGEHDLHNPKAIFHEEQIYKAAAAMACAAVRWVNREG